MGRDLFSVGVIVSVLLVGSGHIVLQRILREVNGKSPADQKISGLWVGTRLGVVLERHRKFFPHSGKRKSIGFLFGAGLCVFFLTFILAR